MGSTPQVPIRVGIVGAGFMGKTHSLAWTNVSSLYWPAHPPVRKLRLADATPELARQGAQRYGWEESAGDWRAITQASDIDIVDVAAPTELHPEIVLDAISNGKHVLCEKPLSTDLSTARRMFIAAEQAGIIHQIGFVYRSFPSIAFAQQLIAQGRIGVVRYFRGQWLSEYAANPRAPHSWRYLRSVAGAGVLADTGSHVIDLARLLVGRDIARVSARCTTFIDKRPLESDPDRYGIVDTDDLTDMLLEFEGGARGSICVARTYVGHNTDMAFEVVGSSGSLRFSWLHSNELQYCSLDEPADVRGYRTISIGNRHTNAEAFWGPGQGIAYSDAFLIEFHNLLNALQRKEPAKPSFLDGLRASEVIEAALKSAETGGWVTVDRYEPEAARTGGTD